MHRTTGPQDPLAGTRGSGMISSTSYVRHAQDMLEALPRRPRRCVQRVERSCGMENRDDLLLLRRVLGDVVAYSPLLFT
jgi:hypothetical protein